MDDKTLVERLRKDAADYRMAPSHEGPKTYNWRDKPHRMVYALCGKLEEAEDTIEAQATRIEALEAALRETMSRCTDCGGSGSFVKHDEVTDRDLWESCASCAVGYAALESQT